MNEGTEQGKTTFADLSQRERRLAGSMQKHENELQQAKSPEEKTMVVDLILSEVD